jgi:hypothetical protein
MSDDGNPILLVSMLVVGFPACIGFVSELEPF